MTRHSKASICRGLRVALQCATWALIFAGFRADNPHSLVFFGLAIIAHGAQVSIASYIGED